MSLRYYITDGTTRVVVESVARAMHAGVDLVQVREKDLPTRDLMQLAHSIRALPNPHATRILINDRADIALACGLDGVHLRSKSITPSALRKILPRPLLIGVSCHSVADVIAADREGADFAVLGPIFATPSKGVPIGVRPLNEAAHSVAIPVLALGGVTLERTSVCLRAGAAGIAGIRIFQ